MKDFPLCGKSTATDNIELLGYLQQTRQTHSNNSVTQCDAKFISWTSSSYYYCKRKSEQPEYSIHMLLKIIRNVTGDIKSNIQEPLIKESKYNTDLFLRAVPFRVPNKIVTNTFRQTTNFLKQKS